MTDYLVKELRASYDLNDAVPMQVCLDAADRIEKLEAALRRIKTAQLEGGITDLEAHFYWVYSIVGEALEGKDDVD